MSFGSSRRVDPFSQFRDQYRCLEALETLPQIYINRLKTIIPLLYRPVHIQQLQLLWNGNHPEIIGLSQTDTLKRTLTSLEGEIIGYNCDLFKIVALFGFLLKVNRSHAARVVHLSPLTSRLYLVLSRYSESYAAGLKPYPQMAQLSGLCYVRALMGDTLSVHLSG